MFEDREISVKTPLGAEDLMFSSMSGHDEISQCFRFELEMASEDIEIKAEDLLGKDITVKIGKEDGVRFFHAYVAEFGLGEYRDGYAYYTAVLRPWFWFLSNTFDNRIFQNKSVIEIVEEVLNEHPDAKFEKRLQETYDPREYCVQYGESNLAFVQRLLEHEGIYYFFEYADGEHTMVLCDANAKLKTVPDFEEIEFQPDSTLSFLDGDYILQWKPNSRVVSGKFAQTDYDFTKPSADLMTLSENAIGHDQDDSEVYHYPGNYTDLGRGDSLTAVRLESSQAPHHTVRARGTVRGLWAGAKFNFYNFPREAENDEYLVLRSEYRMWDDQYRSGGTDREGAGYEIRLDLCPTSTSFRPARRTAKPVMRGPQTAVVVGPAGEEIFTDEYSRVKLHFHWNRLGKQDENSSCFVRVSSVWAGSNWGFIQIPRIGQEVIVDFLEGDPDQPLITGRVYNAEQMPPYSLPDNATQSGWKSNSSPGGGGFNEMRFEDKKGEEEVYFQAEKDHNELIKNDETRTIGHDFKEDVGNDATQSIGHDRTESVDNDKSVTVGNNRTVHIGVDDTETVGNNRKLTVGADENIKVVGSSTEEIDMNHFQTVGLAQKILVKAGRMDQVGLAEVRSIGAYLSLTVGTKRDVKVGTNQMHYVIGSDSWTVGRDETIKIGGNHTVEIDKDQTIKLKGNQSWTNEGGRLVKVGKGQTHDVTEDVWIKSGKAMLLEATDSITLKCGSASIAMQKDGTINIEGKDITVKGSGKINFKASGEITGKGSKINLN